MMLNNANSDEFRAICLWIMAISMCFTGCGKKSPVPENPHQSIVEATISDSHIIGKPDELQKPVRGKTWYLGEDFPVWGELVPADFPDIVTEAIRWDSDGAVAIPADADVRIRLIEDQYRIWNAGQPPVFYFDFEDADVSKKKGTVENIRLTMIQFKDSYDIEEKRERQMWLKKDTHPVQPIEQGEPVILESEADLYEWIAMVTSSRKLIPFVAHLKTEQGKVVMSLTADIDTKIYSSYASVPEEERVSSLVHGILNVQLPVPIP